MGFIRHRSVSRRRCGGDVDGHLQEESKAEIDGEAERKIDCSYLLWIAHNLERVGDRATNIAERVAYITTSEMLELNH